MSDSNVFSKKYNEQFSFSIGETYIDSVTIYPPSLNIDRFLLMAVWRVVDFRDHNQRKGRDGN